MRRELKSRLYFFPFSMILKNWIREDERHWCWPFACVTCNRWKCCWRPSAMRTPNSTAGQWCRRPFAQVTRPFWRQSWKCAIYNDISNESLMYHSCCRNWSMRRTSTLKWSGNLHRGVSVAGNESQSHSLIQLNFCSTVPLVSRLCPSDVYKVYKRGSNVRIDTTLLGFDHTTWQRGNRTYIFKGDGKFSAQNLHIYTIIIILPLMGSS